MNDELLHFTSEDSDAVDSYFDRSHFEDAVFSTEADSIHNEMSMEEFHIRFSHGMSDENKNECLRKIGNYCFSNLQDFTTGDLDEIFSDRSQ